MKLLHLSDLHLGKRYCEASLIDDQRYILEQILHVADRERVDGVMIAGDVYDKSVPPIDAVELFDWFLVELSLRNLYTFIISGNHDSAERLSFGSGLMKGSKVYISPAYNGAVTPVILPDEYGKVCFYLLPFIKPATVRRFFESENIDSYNTALKLTVAAMNVDESVRNVLIAHQFVTGASQAGSEEFIVGDLGNVDAEVFAPFDYVALGHVHGAQNVAGERIRYSGTPLKYSLSEAKSRKSVTVIELKEKGNITVTAVNLQPKRDVVEIRGSYEELTSKKFYGGTSLAGDLVHAVLTDEEEVPDAFGKLRLIYPNLMSVRYDNTRTKESGEIELLSNVAARSPYELFASLYEMQNNAEMSSNQSELIKKLIEKVWGDNL